MATIFKEKRDTKQTSLVVSTDELNIILRNGNLQRIIVENDVLWFELSNTTDEADNICVQLNEISDSDDWYLEFEDNVWPEE